VVVYDCCGCAEQPPQASIVEAFQHFACLYIKYLQIYKKVCPHTRKRAPAPAS
jgi:hypothetical protein